MPRRPPDALVYYLDANQGGLELVEQLRGGGMRCEPHRAHFAPDAADEAWIPPIASRGWVIVTRDFAIQRRRAERAAWTAAGAIVVMLRGEKRQRRGHGEDAARRARPRGDSRTSSRITLRR